MKLYEIFIDNNLEYSDWDHQSRLIVANSLREAETRADDWMKKEYGTSSYGKPFSWANEWSEIDGFKILLVDKIQFDKEKDDEMGELLKFFKEKGVALQITADINYKPTVHAIPAGRNGADLKFTNGETVIEALENMKKKLFAQ